MLEEVLKLWGSDVKEEVEVVCVKVQLLLKEICVCFNGYNWVQQVVLDVCQVVCDVLGCVDIYVCNKLWYSVGVVVVVGVFIGVLFNLC